MKRRKTAQYYPDIHIQCSNNTKIWNTPLHFIPFFCLTDRCLKRTRSIWRYYTSFYSVLQYLRSEKKLFPKNCRIFFVFDCKKDTIICFVYSWYTFTRKPKLWSFDMLRNFFWKSVFSVLRLFSGKELSITFLFYISARFLSSDICISRSVFLSPNPLSRESEPPVYRWFRLFFIRWICSSVCSGAAV